jgi:hypothetical protein
VRFLCLTLLGLCRRHLRLGCGDLGPDGSGGQLVAPCNGLRDRRIGSIHLCLSRGDLGSTWPRLQERQLSLGCLHSGFRLRHLGFQGGCIQRDEHSALLDLIAYGDGYDLHPPGQREAQLRLL